MIDSRKKYRTRIGFEARLYANDGAGAWPIHGAVNVPSSGWSLRQWHEGGRYSHNGPHDLDLIEVKPERWFPIFFDSNPEPGEIDAWMGSTGYPTKTDAMRLAKSATGRTPIDAWKAPE